jgi:hypothetical protein
MAKIKQNHVHKYELTTIGTKGYLIYKCTVPACVHYLNHILAIGRLCLCWGDCGLAVVIDKFMAQKEIKHPMCDSCREARAKRREELIAIGKEE